MNGSCTHACNNNQLIFLARKETYLGLLLLEAKSRETAGRCSRLSIQPVAYDGIGVLSRKRSSKLLLHLKMKMTVMEGWPTKTVFFSFVFLSFFPWSSFCALLVYIVLVCFPSLFTSTFYASAEDVWMSTTVAEEKQLLFLMVAAAQVTEIRVATTMKRRLLLEMQGCS